MGLCLAAPGELYAQAEPEPADGPERPAPSPELETYGEGAYLDAQSSWPADSPDELGFVDKRLEVDPMTAQTILWPTAFTPEAGTVTYTNFFLLGNTLNIAVTDDVSIGTTLVLPSLGAFHAQGTARIRVHDGPNHIVSIVPVIHYQSEGENEFVTTAAVSTGVGVVSDFYLTDKLMVGAGLHLHATVAASTSSVSSVECPDRDAFFNNQCTDVDKNWEGFPSGGHWVALVAHAIYYIDDWVNLRAEAFTGGVAGTFLGAEYLYGRETLAERSTRYQDGDFAVGIPYDSGVTLGLGTGVTAGSAAFQLSGYMYFWDDEVRLTPMFVGAITF
jgi:hypothetical protein